MGWVVNVYSHFVAICRGAALCDGRGRRERGRVKGKGGQYNGVETAGRERRSGRTAAGRQKSKGNEKAVSGTPLNGENSRSPAHRGDFVRMPQKKNKFFEKVVQQFLTNLLTF